MAIRTRKTKTGMRYDVVLRIDGKQRTKTFRRKKDAQRWERESIMRRDEGQWTSAGGRTVKEYLGEYIDLTKNKWKQKTLDDYRTIAQQFAQEYGNLKLENLRAMHMQNYYTMQLDTKTDRTVLNHHRFLRCALQRAVKLQLLPYNVADLTDPPTPEDTEQDAMTLKESIAVLKAVEDNERLYIPVLLGLAMGFRLGEIFGLRWQDINLDEGHLRIRKALQRNKAGLKLITPKSLSSRRYMMIPLPLLKALKRRHTMQAEQKLLLGRGYEDFDLVNCQPNGRPYEPGNLSKEFKKVAKKTLEDLETKKQKEDRRKQGVKKITMHNLRHTNVTLLMEGNIHSLKISKWVGHTDTRLVDKVYAHVRPDTQKEITQQIEQQLFAGQNK